MSEPTPPSTPPPIALTPTEAQTRIWHMWSHMSALAGFVVPFGTILGPLIVWQMKKSEIPSVEAHAKAAMNFQLSVILALVATLIAGFILSFVCIGVVFFFLLPVVGLCGPVFAIIAGMKVNEGKDYKYPWSLNLIK